MNPGPDLFLARRAARADAVAWEEIVSTLGPRIYHLALGFARGKEEAEDLTQEIFLKLYRQLDRYRGNVPLVAWALRLSRNLCIDHYRSVRTERQREVVTPEALQDVPSAQSLEDQQARSERRALLQRAVAQLPEDLATVLVLRDLQGLAYDEIASFLELPLGTLKSRLHRARKELLLVLEPLMADTQQPLAAEAGP